MEEQPEAIVLPPVPDVALSKFTRDSRKLGLWNYSEYSAISDMLLHIIDLLEAKNGPTLMQLPNLGVSSAVGV